MVLRSIANEYLSAAGMNWTCLVYGGPMLFVIIWWIVDARKWFKGPRVSPPAWLSCGRLANADNQVNLEHQMLGREGNRIDGKEPESGDSNAGSIAKDDRSSDDMKAAKLA